ncbi:unnamed protein product [Caenorhabditis angaria]|uniref:Uncharacterized protein n=1 Tax=Caenorhabditis angaria TaxID=860376 RepID=A0A9P1MSG9_9PELO|nr:unnamed protein product [Caenorhabditis angaria]
MDSKIFLFLFSLLLIQQVKCTVFLDEAEQCQKEDGYGRQNFVCDVHGRLAATTRKKLTDILAGLKDRIGCECADGCLRSDGTDSFIGLLHVTSSKNTDDLKRDMEAEYNNAELGNTTCDHGLVMVYLKDTQQLATFRGGDSFVLLGDDDMQKLHKLAAQGSESDTLAVQYLLSNYKQVSEAPIDNWYAGWLPVIGLIVAVLLVLCLLSILLSMLCAKCFCCCKKNKKEKYEVTKPATYKSIEPLYVITPPSTLNPRLHDAIYSTPYSGSPLPYPPPPGTTVPHTPNSTYRYRIDTLNGSGGKRIPRDVAETGSLGQLPIDEQRISHPIYTPIDTAYGTIPRARLASPNSPTLSGGNDPHFLDPRRRQETQTREELIY